MKRDLRALSEGEFDLLVVGGGIFGICAAWEAAQRGLSVALVERGDFAHATSANSFKMVHGGIRYIQHGDVYRVRESSAERRTLLRIAPHLVEPLPILVPTYGYGRTGKLLLRAGCLAYDLLTADRNRGIRDPARRIPWACSLSRKECLEQFPGLEPRGLTGGVVFRDAQMYNPPRLALAFLQKAVEAGAVAANYVAATGFLRRGDRVEGIRARDVESGAELDVRARIVLNAAGPWAPRLLADALGVEIRPPLSFSRDACFIVPRRLTRECALAVIGRTKDPDAILSRPGRHLFLVPWRGYTLVGVWHVVHRGPPDAFTVTERELEEFLDEINGAWPGLGLGLDDVSIWNAGLVLFGENVPGSRDLSYGKRSRIADHAVEHGVEGLVSVVGVRFTTARRVGERVMDLVARKLGRKIARSVTAGIPVRGGDIDDFDAFARSASSAMPPGISDESMRSLLRNHGSEYPKVLAWLEGDPAGMRTLGGSHVLEAEVVHAVRAEMARTLADVVFRRTDLGTGSDPGEDALAACARRMALEMGWSDDRVEKELEAVGRVFARLAPV